MLKSTFAISQTLGLILRLILGSGATALGSVIRGLGLSNVVAFTDSGGKERRYLVERLI
jgi:hypothetical protein